MIGSASRPINGWWVAYVISINIHSQDRHSTGAVRHGDTLYLVMTFADFIAGWGQCWSCWYHFWSLASTLLPDSGCRPSSDYRAAGPSLAACRLQLTEAGIRGQPAVSTRLSWCCDRRAVWYLWVDDARYCRSLCSTVRSATPSWSPSAMVWRRLPWGPLRLSASVAAIDEVAASLNDITGLMLLVDGSS